VSSLHASQQLVRRVLPESCRQGFSEVLASVVDEFKLLNPPLDDDDLNFDSQRDLDALSWKPRLSRLVSTASSARETASILAAQEVLSRKWLEALPVPQLGTVVDDTSFNIAICLRLGIAPCVEHKCRRCSQNVTSDGTHGLSCRRSWGRSPRHSSINEEVKRGLCTARVPATREPIGLFNNQLRPDGITLVTWRRGRCAAWDVTVVDTLAPSYVRNSAVSAGSAADMAEVRKCTKYAAIPDPYEFHPLAFETLGSMGTKTKDFINDLCGRLRVATGDSKAGSYFLQRLSLELIRGNALAILGTMVGEDGFDHSGLYC
jgi:hypothetical protein